MSENETYNGWSNRETWAVALWINNEEGWLESVRESLATLVEDTPDLDEEGCSCREWLIFSDGLCRCGHTEDEHDHGGWCQNPDLDNDGNLAYSAGQLVKDNVESLVTADGYRETFGEQIPEQLVRVAEDIGSLYRVDWSELGASFLEDMTS